MTRKTTEQLDQPGTHIRRHPCDKGDLSTVTGKLLAYNFVSERGRLYFYYSLVGLLVLCGVALLFRNLAIGPYLVGDEFQYSMMARKVAYRLDWIPNYLFSWVYKSTHYCGNNFYSCGKILNSVFFCLCALFVFKTARLFVGQLAGILLVVLFCLSPFNVYTTQFMPETMYGAVAWMLLYFYLSRRPAWARVSVVVAALGVSVLSVIKPHGVFFGGIFLCALVADMLFVEGIRKRTILANAALFVAVFLAARLFIGFCFAGTAGLSIFGTSYSADATRHPVTDYQRILVLTATSAWKHVLAMALIAGVPISMLLTRTFRKGPDGLNADRLSTFALFFFLGMIAITAAFTATVANTSPSETMNRLHTRYYNYFDFVFVLIVVAELARGAEPGLRSRIIAGTCVAALAVFSITYLPAHFQQSLMDNPDVHGLFASPFWLNVWAGVNLCLVILWIFRARLAGVLFLALQVPLGLCLSTSLLTRDIRSMASFSEIDPYSAAAAPARVFWGKQVPDFFVAGPGVANSFHTMFSLDKQGAMIELAPEEPLRRSAIPPGVVDGIVVGNHPTDFPFDVIYVKDSVKIIKIDDRQSVGPADSGRVQSQSLPQGTQGSKNTRPKARRSPAAQEHRGTRSRAQQ